MRRFLFWLVFNLRLGPLVPGVLGLALGRRESGSRHDLRELLSSFGLD